MPGTSPRRFWDDLLTGRDLVSQVDPQRWSQTPYLHPNKAHPGSTYTFAAGSIGDVSGFDAGFFGISPREAALMDPQQRLLLEMSWETLENANVRPSTLRGSNCGVYIGISSSDYSWRLADDLAALDASFATGNTSSIAANRLSYFYDLRGPSMAIDTACSSSLVAFHQACRAITAGEISQALAGAISLHLHPVGFVSFAKASMLSRHGRCRVFDAAADGYVRSEGGGIFLLKDLEQALADGNPVLAVVTHSAVNTDGRKSGLTVPSASAQASLLSEAYRSAGIRPEEIDYIETHGTGTPVGDPVETRALSEAIAQHRPKDQPLLIGSVKGNVGHLEAAAGVAGLVKALYCIKHRVVPAHVGLETPNPQIPFDEWNLKVPTAARPLREAGRVIIGVNSFGFGGANAHVILESHEGETSSTTALPNASALPIVVSARDPRALRVAASELADLVACQPRGALYDISYQTVFGRDAHAHRAVLYGRSSESIAESLRAFAAEQGVDGLVECGTRLETPRGAAFVYSGNGAQWSGMGYRLLADPTFKAAVREVDELYSRYADHSLENELAGEHGEGRYERTEFAQPALFAWQVGVTAMLRQRGLVPIVVLGHSVGEVAAAWACGALSLAAAVSVIYHRSTLQGLTKGSGGMTAVALDEPRAQELLKSLALAPPLVVASINSSRGVTIAGPSSELELLERALAAGSVVYKRLALDYAFHSPAMDRLAVDVHRALAHLEPDDSIYPFHSAVTGERLSGKSLGADYWWRNIRAPVLFDRATRGVIAEGCNIFVEIGPHAALQRYLLDGLADSNVAGRVITTGMRDDDSVRRIHAATSQALIAGAQVEWQRVLPWRGRNVQLPGYPWQRERHWHPSTSESLGQLERVLAHPLLGYPRQRDEQVWEATMDTVHVPFLSDHVIGEATVFPGTGYVEVALAMAACWQRGATLLEIEDLEIRSPMFVAASPSRMMRSSFDADGQFAIKSREQLSEDAWTLHSTGRILARPTDLRLNRLRCTPPARAEEFTGRSHADCTRAAGLRYGPAFQTITRGWLEDGTVLAALDIPEVLGPGFDDYVLHPALLDCALQLIIELLSERAADHAGFTFVPTRFGRVSCRRGCGAPKYARARLLNHGPHSICAQFEIFDQALSPIALLEEVRFQAILVQRAAGEQVRSLHYAAVPRPLASATAAPASAFQALGAELAACLQDADVQRERAQYAAEVEPLLTELCTGFVHEALAEIRTVEDDARAYYRRLLALARPDGLLDSERPPTSAQDIWNSLVSDYPDYFPIFHAVGCVGLHLPALIAGDRRVGELLPEQYSRPALLRQAFGVRLRARLAGAIQQLVHAECAALPHGQRLQIAEISGGAPDLGGAICRALDFDRADYTFLGPEGTGLEEARRLKQRHPDIHVLALAATSAAPQVSLVILWLDFATPEEALHALDCARGLLAPGGSLVMIGQQPGAWLDVVFGRETSPGSDASWSDLAGSPEFWTDRAQQLGLRPLAPRVPAEHAQTGPFFILNTHTAAHAPAALPPADERHWLVLTDAHGYSARLAVALCAEMQATGSRATCASPRDPEELAALLDGFLSQHGEYGVVHLSGLKNESENADSESLLQAQVARCADAARLARLCEEHQRDALCCFVTADAQTHLLPGGAAGTSLGCAALSGLVRTLMNEASGCAVRLIDVQTASEPLDATVRALASELRCADDEQEVILSRQGGRYAPRLRPARAPETTRAASADARVTRLGFAVPGQLANLRWAAHPRPAPGEGELEVAVKATGVNFRDIMYALGMLSDEAVESGFAGPTLGLEFAGVVSRVGPGYSNFAPGNAVVGFAPSSFSDHLITPISAVSLMPSELSFEAAATLPSAFFTAYYALHHLAHLREGESVLIHGACGGVGLAAIQLARWCGAEVFATAGTDAKRDVLRLLGLTHIFDSRSLAFADQILDVTGGRGVDVVLNSLAGEAINRNLRILKPFGRFLELGKRDFYENSRVGLRPFRNNISYFGIDADQLMSQQPELTGRLFAEVLALLRERVLRPLPYRTFDAGEVIDAFRCMQQSRHIGKLVVTYGNGTPEAQAVAPARGPRLELPAHSTWLVTGGLSGFGLRTAEWLVERGARALVLIGRRGLETVEARAALARLERRGVRLLARACDVTDRAALARLLEEAARDLPPLRGIVHAAMVIEDGLIRDMDAAQIQRVLAPKLAGALLLDELTRGLPIEFFVMYSSATALFGNPGQGNYVAANCALAALARRRRAQGLPATCVHWGAIGDVGFLARNHKIRDALQNRMGGTAVESATALAMLEAMLLARRTDLGVLDFRWGALKRFLPSAGSPKFGELAREAGDVAEEEGAQDLRRMLEELPPGELEPKLIELLKIEIGEVLRMGPEKIDTSLSLEQMGLDSLMRVELAVALESRFQIRRPVLTLSDTPTVAKMAAWLAGQLRGGEPDAAGDDVRTQVQLLASQHASEVAAMDLDRIADHLLATGTSARRMIN
jgi:acyl transferase domain-containing protein/NADPH:quinone reductase-like Zn-dependent oxidoreductase/NAD(P)-dependent dehydrogenase (short-subunit alcohol dehydrogenase family)/acyl carrier protein